MNVDSRTHRLSVTWEWKVGGKGHVSSVYCSCDRWSTKAVTLREAVRLFEAHVSAEAPVPLAEIKTVLCTAEEVRHHARLKRAANALVKDYRARGDGGIEPKFVEALNV